MKTPKRNLRWRKYINEYLPNARLWCAKELHRSNFAAACSAVPGWRFLIAFLHSLGQKRPSQPSSKRRYMLSPNARLQGCIFWIWAILVVAGRTIKHHKYEQNDNANKRDKTDEQPPACTISVVKSAYGYGDTWHQNY